MNRLALNNVYRHHFLFLKIKLLLAIFLVSLSLFGKKYALLYI